MRVIVRKQSRRLLKRHEDYLNDLGVLAEWRPYSLTARCAIFERKFPGKKISSAKLRKVYRKLGVKKRVLKDEIFLTEKQLERQKKGRDHAFPLIV